MNPPFDTFDGFYLSRLQGAHPSVQDMKGRTPAMTAAELGQDSTVALLAKKQADMELVDEEGKGLLVIYLKAHQKCHCIFCL